MSKMLLTGAAAALLAVVSTSPILAADRTQLIRSSGLTIEQASGMSLDEIVAHKFSREGNDSRQEVVKRGTTSASGVSTRRFLPGVGTSPAAADRTQLARSAGLTLEEARGMSLGEIAAHKFSREGNDSRQEVVERRATSASSVSTRRYLPNAGIRPSSVTGKSLDEMYVEMINRSSSGDDRQELPTPRAGR